ncbi:MAG: hypothetical protein JRH06_07100 [Deltaproteobacteria bacterium]|nr:hypothetical protein [Deltaproteobacteria bacterium]
MEMLVVPKERPSFENLNSYYLDIDKLFEHFQGEFGAGCVHFHSSSHESVVFFDQHEVLDGVFQDNEEQVRGRETLNRLNHMAKAQNFAVDIYEIEGDIIYLWANTPSGEELYRGLTTEFTDLKGLLKKMASEDLTGFIHIAIGKGNESGIVFLMNGKICGDSYSWKHAPVGGTKEDTELLINKAIESGGTFDVNRLSLKGKSGGGDSKEDISKGPPETLKLLGEVLAGVEELVSSKRSFKGSFGQLLKKKFLEKANKYPFLDPFAAEFQYTDRRVRYVGDAAEEIVVKAVKECLGEIGEEAGVLPKMGDILKRLPR